MGLIQHFCIEIITDNEFSDETLDDILKEVIKKFRADSECFKVELCFHAFGEWLIKISAKSETDNNLMHVLENFIFCLGNINISKRCIKYRREISE